MHCRSKCAYCLESGSRIHFPGRSLLTRPQEMPVRQEFALMMNHVSRASITVCAVLLLGSLIQAQRRSSRSPSLPADTPISVRINENLSSETAQAGDEFSGVLTQPVVANGATAFPRGATITGQIMSVKKSGRLSD